MHPTALVLALALNAAPAAAADPQRADALLVLPSERTAFDKGFQDLLDKGGAKLLESYPPSVFTGVIPKDLDATLKARYGALVYREKVEDWSSFARYGERAVFAVNLWNKRFVADPPEAPLIVSSEVKQAKRGGMLLEWNAVMKALYYRLQVSRTKDFSRLLLDARTAANSYAIFPVFWGDGVYYWRAAGVMGLNNGAMKDGAFSEPFSFAISRPGVAEPKASLPAPAVPREKEFSKNLYWGPSAGFRYYRLQLSETEDFPPPQIDVFSDTCSYRSAGLPVRAGADYYMRVMGADGTAVSGWSEPVRIGIRAPETRRRRTAKGK